MGVFEIEERGYGGGGGCDTWTWRTYGWKLDKIDEQCQWTYSRNSTDSGINSEYHT